MVPWVYREALAAVLVACGAHKLHNIPSPTMLHLKSSTLLSRKMGTSCPTPDSVTAAPGTSSLRCAGARNDRRRGSRTGPCSVGAKVHDTEAEP